METVKTIVWYVAILIVAFIIAWVFSSCSLCRHTAVTQAQEWSSKGYESGVATYKVATSQRVIMGLSHGYHAQAVVKIDGQWKWLNGWGDMSNFPLYRVGGDLTLWDAETYRRGVETYERTGKLVMPESGYRSVDGVNL